MRKNVDLSKMITLSFIIMMIVGCKASSNSIAFVRYDSAGPLINSEIYKMDVEERSITQLTFDESFSRNPSWSPDGTRIVFDSRREGKSQIYTMDRSGSNVIKLTDESGFDPAWSPDGQPVSYTHLTLPTKRIV